MAKIYTIETLLQENRKIYQVPDDRLYSIQDLIFNHHKFIFLLQKDLQKKQQTYPNLDIAASWFFTLVNRYHVDLEKKAWQRYSYKCPFCLEIPCFCKNEAKSPKKTGRPASRKPKDLNQWQEMTKKIYPNDKEDQVFFLLLNNLNKLIYLIRHFDRKKTKFSEIENASVDHFVLILRLYNSLGINLSKNFQKKFSHGCYVCHKSPCICNYFE